MDVATSHGRLSQAVRDFIARPHKLLIDGQWVESSSGKRFAVFDPANGQQIAQVAEGNAQDVEHAVTAARRAFENGPWSRMKPTERGNDDDLDRVAQQGNATGFGVAVSIATRDIGIAHRLKAGSVWITVHNCNDVALPFGGYTQSGWRRKMGYEAMELYTETKGVAARL